MEGSGDTANSQFSGNTVGFTGRGDTAQITNSTIVTDDTSGGVEIVGSGDTVNAVSGGTQSAPVLDDPTVSDIDALYNMVLERDPSSAELIGAQTELATGVGLDGLMGTLANSVEAQADMTSTFEAASGAYQSLMTAQPQSNEEQSVSSIDPTQAEFSAFADVMSTSYGAPIEIVSFDPYNGAQTELADTSATNLLAELPVLETEANGVNLGLKLADGTELQFASTARLTTFLYSVAVQQMQATQFVTDNYNLDMQWLNTIDQPLDGQIFLGQNNIAWCVAFVQAVAPIGRTSGWFAGPVPTASTQLGMAVATFDPVTDAYINSTVTSHVGVFEGFDSSGRMILIDQYPTSGGVGVSYYSPASTKFIGNPSNYHIVLLH